MSTNENENMMRRAMLSSVPIIYDLNNILCDQLGIIPVQPYLPDDLNDLTDEELTLIIADVHEQNGRLLLCVEAFAQSN